MDITHEVTDADRQPENVAAALRKRQAAEDAETIRVRGPQRPADEHPVASPPSVAPTASRGTMTGGRPVGAITRQPAQTHAWIPADKV